MAVTVTNSTVLAYNAPAVVTANAATADTNGLGEVFTITPTKANQSCALIIGGTGSAAVGDIAVSVAAGDMWAGGEVAATVKKNTEVVIQLETAKVTKKDGTIAVTLTPGESDKLKATHSAYVKFVELR